jgi:transcriptional regulator of aromatic amino acid metabolism
MTVSADALALLNAFSEPALIVTPAGRVDHANRAALVQFGKALLGAELSTFSEDPPALHAFLKSASGDPRTNSGQAVCSS